MPLPDADKKSPRVYTLLQNLDLENLSADNLADVGDPIAIEEANEDELRRLCLVAFARMVTKGSFDGWLTAAGGGGSGYGVLAPLTPVGAYDGWDVAHLAPWGICETSIGGTAAAGYPSGYPFVSPKSGDLASIEVYVSSASATSTLKVAIYSQDEDTHMPSTMLGFVELDTSSTGSVTQTSFSGDTPTLVAGTQYWAIQARGSSAYATMHGILEEGRAGFGITGSPSETTCQANFAGDWNAADPVDGVGTLNQYVSGNSMRFILKW